MPDLKMKTVMKKIYQTPEANVVNIAPHKLMQFASGEIPVAEEDYDGEMSIESRKFSSTWDDD